MGQGSLQLDVTEYLGMEIFDHVAVGLVCHDVDVLPGPIKLAGVAGMVVQLAADDGTGLDSDGLVVKLEPASVAPIIDPLRRPSPKGRWRGGGGDEQDAGERHGSGALPNIGAPQRYIIRDGWLGCQALAPHRGTVLTMVYPMISVSFRWGVGQKLVGVLR